MNSFAERLLGVNYDVIESWNMHLQRKDYNKLSVQILLHYIELSTHFYLVIFHYIEYIYSFLSSHLSSQRSPVSSLFRPSSLP